MAKYQLVESRMIKELGVDLLEASEQATFGDEHAVGICIKDCGYYVEGIEPDAEGYLCEANIRGRGYIALPFFYLGE